MSGGSADGTSQDGTSLAHLEWPRSQLARAVEALATRHRLATDPSAGGDAPPVEARDPRALDRAVDALAARLGVEAEPVRPLYKEAEAVVRAGAPALLATSMASFLVLVRCSGRRATLLSPDLREVRVPVRRVVRALRAEKEAPILAEIEPLLDRAGLSPRRRRPVRSRLLQHRLSERRLPRGWLLRAGSGAPLSRRVREAGLPRTLAGFLVAHFLQFAAFIGSWWVLGKGTLDGTFGAAWFVAWALLLAAMIPFLLLESWWQGVFAVRAGTLLRGALMLGAVQLEPDEVRHRGAGRHFGHVAESEAVETLALGGGLLAVLALLDLVIAGVVLALGSGGALHVALLVVWMALALGATWRYFPKRRRWVGQRVAITHDLVEQMVGHRTRLAQQRPEERHTGEDRALEEYLALSAGMDRLGAWIRAVLPRGWLLLGVLGLAPGLVAGASPAALAIALGGVLLAHRAFEEAAFSIEQLTGAGASWGEVRQLLEAAFRKPPTGDPALALAVQGTGSDGDGPRAGTPEPTENGDGPAPVLDVHGLDFRYPGRDRPVLRSVSVQVRRGDRLLLEGPSGGGKSTLVSLLAGVREPDHGLVLLSGLDRRTWGADEWRRRVAAAPQFHDNHVFTGTFGFNLYLNRWPRPERDLRVAEELCEELGLGGLLRRMPAGIHQMVGSSGWQLSHGERSRLFIARALLQDPEVVILDESFGALDPETMSRAVHCVLRRAETLVVVAHP